jgi:dienelactone hydrolase
MKALIAVALAGACCWGADEQQIQALLSKEILGPKQAMVEVQAYAEAHTPVLPGFQSAAAWQQYAERLRARVLDEVVLRGEAKRWSESPSRVEWLGTIPGNGYRIRKLRFEAVPGLWVPALLYEPENLQGKVPAVLNVNGHEGNGKAIPYIQARCINLAKRGMLALNPEWIGKGELSPPGYEHTRLQQLDLCGTSGVGVFYLSLKRSLDILLAHEHADAQRVAVTGLSGGGWQTIMISSLDTRVKLTNPVAGYSSFATRAQFPEPDLGDSEQTPSDLATVADYTHLTALMAPRPTQLTNNARDNCCFRADYAPGPLLREALPFFRLFNAEKNLRYHLNFDAGHNYGEDNREALYRMLGDFFYPGDPNFRRTEIPVTSEIRTAEALAVEMPAETTDLHKLALSLSRDLPRKVEGDARARLEKVVHAKRFSVEAFETGRNALAVNWRLSMDRNFTVPAVELAEGTPKSSVIVVADAGRTSMAADAARLLREGKRVVAVDPFYFGESRMATKDWLFAILLAALGERPLGIQASQIAATARWLDGRRSGPVEILADGPRTGLAALVAAAIEPKAIAGVTVRNGMRSLKEIIEKDLSADKTPELFCFGLLETFDIDQLAALAGRDKVKLENGR